MNDDKLPVVCSVEAEGKRRDAEARIRALHEKWPTAQIYSAKPSVPTAPAGTCGRDCGACQVVGTTQLEED